MAQTATTEESLRLRKQAGAHAAHAKYGSHHMTSAARHAANVTRFEALVDPDGKLDPVERAKRADHARQAHMKMLAAKAVESRKAKAAVAA